MTGLNEAFSGFDNIRHNSMATLIPLWIIPNSAWLVLPSYMIYVVGMEVWAALDAAGDALEKCRVTATDGNRPVPTDTGSSR